MRILVSLLLSSVLLFISCQEDPSIKRTLQVAQTVLATNPDSALALLQHIREPESLPTNTFSQWCLLYAQACDLSEEDMPFVHQLKRANEYFQQKDSSPREQALCELYLGRSFEEDNEFDKAMQHFLTAVDIAKEAKEYRIAGKVYNQMAKMYEFNDKDKDAAGIYQKAGDCFILAKDSIMYAYALRNIGWIFARDGDFPQALKYNLHALDISLPHKDSLLLSSLTNRLGVCYKAMNELELAEEHLFQSISYQEENSAPTYLAIADLYLRQKKYDKAYRYTQKAAESKTENKSMGGGVLYQFYLIEKDLGHASRSLDYYEQFVAFNDSLTDLQQKINSDKVEKRYGHSKLLNANYELYAKQQRTIILCILLLLACITTALFFRIHLSRKNKYIHEQQDLLQSSHAQLMSKELSLKGMEMDIQQIRENLLHNSSVWKKIVKNSTSIQAAQQSPLTEKEWLTFTEIIKATYISFHEELYANFPGLTLDELRFCCLLKAGLNSQELSILLDIQPESVNHKRYRIMKKGGYENRSLILEKIILKL